MWFCTLRAGLAAMLIMAFIRSAPAAEKPRHGGILIYMIPADAPPSLDGHREGTFAMLHATAPFYSVLMRVNPANPNCNSVVNPVLDTQKYLPRKFFAGNYGFYDDPTEVDIYEKMLRETDPVKQRVLMRAYERQIVDIEAHEFPMLWWNRIIPYRSYVRG